MSATELVERPVTVPNTRRRLLPAGAAAVVAAPFVLLVALVARYAVNVPFQDDWEFEEILRAHRAGTLGFGAFWAQHNEHRILFPNLVMYVLAMPSHWDARYEMAFSLVVAVTSFGFLVAILWWTLRGRWTAILAAAMLVSVVVFSPVQWQNWLWGWQIEWFMNIAGVIVAIWALTAWRTPNAWKQILVSVCGATFAMFSMGSGVLVWASCLPLLVFTRQLRRWIPVWIGVAIIETALYYTDYRPSEYGSDLPGLKRNFGDYVEYVAVYLSRSLLPGLRTHVAILITVGLVAMLLIGAGYVWLRHRAEAHTMLPWLCLAAYGVVSAAATGWARLYFGVAQAYSSRYTTVSQLFVIGALVVAVKVLQVAWQAQDKTVMSLAARFVPVPALLLVAGFALHNYPTSIADMRYWNGTLTAAQTCARTATSSADDCLLVLYPNKDVVWERLQYLRKIGWGGVTTDRG